jgi:serine phosphatase RsbU (regulator of sigma subunit)
MQRRIALDAERLATYYRTNEAEQDLARHILNGLTANAMRGGDAIQQCIRPAVQFSGDVITATQSGGRTYLMLADSTGHGLAAAICCVPAVLTFYSMAEKSFSIDAIAREINTQLRRSLPVGRFVAAVLVSIEEARGELSIWNGGLPETLVVDRHGELVGRVKSSHAPLGILADEDFDPAVESVRWSDNATVVLCSDGVTEARNQMGDQFGLSGLIRAITSTGPAQRFDALREAVTSHLGGADNHDDISFVVAQLQAPQATQA